MIGVTTGMMDSAVQEELTCRAEIHLKVGLEVKLKSCGTSQFQGYFHTVFLCGILYIGAKRDLEATDCASCCT